MIVKKFSYSHTYPLGETRIPLERASPPIPPITPVTHYVLNSYRYGPQQHTMSQFYMLMRMIRLYLAISSAFERPHYYWLYIGCILLYKKEGVTTLWLSIRVVLLKRYILYSPRILLPLYYDDKQTKGNYAS